MRLLPAESRVVEPRNTYIVSPRKNAADVVLKNTRAMYKKISENRSTYVVGITKVPPVRNLARNSLATETIRFPGRCSDR